jgi:aspartyl protease family protein
MSGALGLGTILFAVTVLVATFGERPIAGLAPEEFAVLSGLGALALVMAGWIVNEFRTHWGQGVRAILVWGAVFSGIVATYAQRDELNAVLDRMIGEVAPGRPVVTAAGEVVVARRADGSFTLTGRINGRDARFIFDTGATAVVLTAETAAAAGLREEALNYSVPVATANGRTMAAPVTIDDLAIGPIAEKRVRALVARPGALRENLLGMTFLDRLASYEVRGNRLILRRGA